MKKMLGFLTIIFFMAIVPVQSSEMDHHLDDLISKMILEK